MSKVFLSLEIISWRQSCYFIANICKFHYMSFWTVQKNKHSLKRYIKINENECRQDFVPKQNTSIVMKVLSYLSFLSLMLPIIPVRDMTAEALRKLRPFGNLTIMNLKFTFGLLFVRCLCPTSPIKWLSCSLF